MPGDFECLNADHGGPERNEAECADPNRLTRQVAN